MEKIKEKPTLGERVKEKAVSAPKELLRKGLDDGSERLRTQLRDTAQQGRRDEYGGDAIEDTAASGLHRAEKELLKQRKKKNAEQSASPQDDASAPSSNSDVPPVIRTREAEAARARAPSPPAQEQARQAAMKQAVKTKNAYISTQRKTVMTAAPEPQRQGQQTFIQEQGRKASRQQAQRRRAERQSIGKALGYEIHSLEDFAGVEKIETWDALYAMGHGCHALTSIAGPNDVNYRYLTEDILIALVCWASIADQLGIETPIMDAIITLIGVVHETDWFVNGRSAEKLGLAGKNIKQIKII